MFKFIKYVCIVSLIVTPTFLKQDIAVAGGGFARSCTDVRVNDSVDRIHRQVFIGLAIRYKCHFYQTIASCNTTIRRKLEELCNVCSTNGVLVQVLLPGLEKWLP